MLARAPGHDAAIAAGDVLSALGDALEALPGGARARDQIVEVRFQAKRLRRSDGLSFGLAKWIEEGLTAALDGLDRSAPSGNYAAYWIGAARTGLKSIDSRSSLTFQGGPVQDAARTTVDAFLIVVRGPCSCSDPRSSGTGSEVAPVHEQVNTNAGEVSQRHGARPPQVMTGRIPVIAAAFAVSFLVMLWLRPDPVLVVATLVFWRSRVWWGSPGSFCT